MCRFYGWTVDHILAMPAKRFFLMYEVAHELQCQEFQKLVHVARTAAVTDAGYLKILEFFRYTGKETPQEEEPKKKELSGDEARYAVMAAFAKDTRLNRNMH